ncbi:MAG TPA: aspartyl protease family protein [Stellaceae bacterium]|nr:aspartyl protease family protein [Stellaceae bacterium]
MIEGQLSMPQFGIDGQVLFLIDTGAERTILMPADAIRLGVEFDKLKNQDEGIGFGGRSTMYPEPARVAFTDGVGLFVYHITLDIAEDTEDGRRLPSVLGRDVLNRWHIEYSFPKGKIEIFTDGADEIFAVD